MFLLKMLGILFLGICLGVVLQRARFCIASAFTDFMLFRDSNLLRATLILIAICTVGFTIIQAVGYEGYIVAIGWRTVAGGFIFGIGMTLAGGCAVGTLMRIGEGYFLYIFVLIGLIVGSALGARHYDYWGTSESLQATVFFPEYLGWIGALLLQLILIFALWSLLGWLSLKSGD